MISELRTESLEGMRHGLSLHGFPAATLLGELVAPLDRSALFALETLISSSFRPSSSSVVGQSSNFCTFAGMNLAIDRADRILVGAYPPGPL